MTCELQDEVNWLSYVPTLPTGRQPPS